MPDQTSLKPDETSFLFFLSNVEGKLNILISVQKNVIISPQKEAITFAQGTTLCC